MKKIRTLLLPFLSALLSFLDAKISTPAIFGPIWFYSRTIPAQFGEKLMPLSIISLSFAGKTYQTKANEKGNWQVTLDPHPASKKPLNNPLISENSFDRNLPHGKENISSQLTYENILVGEVWLCSGQSNMQWSVSIIRDSDLESLSAHYPNLRLITIPQVGTQEPQYDFKGAWESATPETSANFSAVGYFFGRRLHQILGSGRIN